MHAVVDPHDGLVDGVALGVGVGGLGHVVQLGLAVRGEGHAGVDPLHVVGVLGGVHLGAEVGGLIRQCQRGALDVAIRGDDRRAGGEAHGCVGAILPDSVHLNVQVEVRNLLRIGILGVIVGSVLVGLDDHRIALVDVDALEEADLGHVELKVVEGIVGARNQRRATNLQAHVGCDHVYRALEVVVLDAIELDELVAVLARSGALGRVGDVLLLRLIPTGKLKVISRTSAALKRWVCN